MRKKTSFFHDHYFIEKNKKIYTSGTLNSDLWKKYSLMLDSDITICARLKKTKGKEKLTYAEYDHVSFVFLNSLSDISSLIIKNEEHKKIESIVIHSDLVIARLPSEIGLYAAKVALKNKIPLLCELVACAKDSLFYQGSIKAKLYSFILSKRVKKIILQSPNVIYVTNEFLQNRYPCKNNTIGISDVDISFINDISPEEKANKILDNILNNKIKFGIIGNISNNIKGIDIAIKALSKLKNIEVELEIVGSGNNEKLTSLAKTLNVNVCFHGFLNKKQVYSWLNTIDIYLQPSRTEGLSRSVLEAMSQGCPVITSNVGGLPEITHNQFIHRKNNANELLNKIELIINNNKLILELVNHSFATANLYTSENLNLKRINFYKNLNI